MSGTAVTTREQLPAVIEHQPATPPTPAPQQVQLPEDPDDRAVAEARAEVARIEEGNQGGDGAPAPKPAAAPQPAGRQQGQRPAAQPQQPMVPAKMLAEEKRKGRVLEDENLYLKGALAARSQPAPTGAPGQPNGGAPPQQQPTIEEQIQAEGRRIIEASKQFDQGELSLEQFKAIDIAANDRIASLRTQHLLAYLKTTASPSGPVVGIADAAVLEKHLEDLTAAHPWSALLNQQEIDWLSHVARDEFRGRGEPINPANSLDTMRLRQRVAELSTQFGPTWYPNHKVPAPAAPSQPQPLQTGARPSAPARQARATEGARLAGVAARQPPLVSTAGFADTGEASLTAEKVGAMSEDEILALPRSSRDRFLHGG